MSICLTQDEIEGYLADSLAPEHHARVVAHLGDCEACRKKVESRQADGRLFEKIRRAYDTETASSSRATRIASADFQPAPLPIKGYKILGEIHRGGQGIVYKAIQNATKRTVALKVLLQGTHASPRQRRRFEREIDLIASLQHPNIITIYDSGQTEDGRLFFAMEYIHGQPLNDFLASNKLDLTEKIRIFLKIAAAVNYAHQRGVIHRDLKPGNIRVDANNTPHVLDFGLAKAAGLDLSGGAPVTVTGEFTGSLPYASPEQTRGDPNLIDVRTDVYSLGVIFYEMLTGASPYPVVGPIADVIRNISELEPRKPSTICRNIDDEVETMLLKALAKDKERRYQSAGALADDVGRYLDGEPLEAKRDSRLYILKKTLAHYKRQALVAGAVLLLLTAAVSVAVYYGREAAREAFERSRLLAAQQETNQLVSDAKRLIDGRESLEQAQAFLNRAIVLSPENEPAYIYRGLLKAIRGLNAGIEKKDAWLDEAVDDFFRAHEAAGGRRLDEPDPQTHAAANDGRRGSCTALLYAADLLRLAGRDAEAWDAFQTAESLASSDGAALGNHPSSVDASFYDIRNDPLAAAPDLLSESPAAAHMKPDPKGVVRRALNGEIAALDPLHAESGRDYEIIELLFDTLFQIIVVEAGHPTVAPNPSLIENVEYSENGLPEIITLHQNLTWHDCEPLTAEDVVYSWRMQKDAGGTLQRVAALENNCVLLEYEEYTAAAEWELTFYLVPRHIYDAPERRGGAASEESPIGSGPFRWSSTSTENVVVVDRWEDYPDDAAPLLKQIEFHALSKSNERIQALIDDRIDIVNLSSPEFRWMVNGASFPDNIVKVIQPAWAYVYICWNGDGANPFFSDPNTRRAMTHAMNIRKVLRQRFGGLYSPCTGIYCDDSWMSNPNVAPLEYDPGKAAALLDSAGWTVDESFNGIRSREGAPFAFTLLIPVESPCFENLAYDLQRDLLAVGVRMNIETEPFNTCQTRMENGDFEACALRLMTSLHPDQGRIRWETGGSKNYAGYSNPRVDALYDQACRTTDPVLQRTCYQNIEKLIYQDQPVTFLWEAPELLAVNKRLRGLRAGPRGFTGSYPGARTWWLPAAE